MFALETLKNGTPLLVSHRTGVAELIKDGRNELLFNFF